MQTNKKIVWINPIAKAKLDQLKEKAQLEGRSARNLSTIIERLIEDEYERQFSI